MADVALDHNMDFSIDTQGPFDNNDDIEIDLDVQEPVEDRDGDVMVDDASVTASDHPEYENDADMVDEDYNEGNAIDAEYSYQQSNEFKYADQETYGAGKTYEAEMEDEYEEDIDAPIPGTGTLELQGSIAEEAHPQPRETSVPESSHGKSKSSERGERSSPAPRAESVGPPGSPGECQEDENTIQPKEDIAGHLQEEHYHEDNGKDTEEFGGETEHQTQSNENEQFVESTERFEGKDYTAPAEENFDYESSQESTEEVNLRNVKVLYQDSEISLFPPMEDDPTETYFIEDLSMAHKPIGQLFHACRSVLDEHITEQEELVLDIESLNLHLSENASQNFSITLSQITKVYRDLSLNDGVNEPEPLYLTLSTRESFESAYHNLLQFVEDGKGLTNIHSWDEYEQGEAEGDTLIPQHDGAEASKSTVGDRSDEPPVEASTLESQEPDFREENAEESVHPLPAGQSEEETTTAPAGSSPTPEDTAHGSVDVDKNAVRSTSPEQGVSVEETQATMNEHCPRGVEQPGEDANVGKTSETGHQEPQEYGSSEEGYLELSNEVEQTGEPDGPPSMADSAEEAREVDVEGEYSLPDDTNNAPQWPEGQEPAKTPNIQSHPQTAPEEVNVSCREESRFNYDTHDSYQPLHAGDAAKYDHIEIDVRDEEPAIGKEDNVDHPVEDIDEPEIDISIENNGQPNHESNDREVDLPKVEIEAAPGTPGTSHGLFDIEEDIFKSPVAKPVIPLQVDESHQEFTLHGTSQEHDRTGVETANGEARLDTPDLESGEVSAFDDEELQTENDKFHPGKSPTSVKRPRPDDENDVLEESVPELKRHRSE